MNIIQMICLIMCMICTVIMGISVIKRAIVERNVRRDVARMMDELDKNFDRIKELERKEAEKQDDPE